MKISAIVPTFNRRTSLTQCLDSLFAQDLPSDQYEVITVVDGSTDGTSELLTQLTPECTFQYVEQQNQGQAAAHNAGIALACGDLLLFLDDDCIADPSLLKAHLEAHQSTNGAVVVGPIFVHARSPRSAAVELERRYCEAEFRRLTTQGPTVADLMLCANSSIPRSLIAHFRFDSRYRRSLDIEMGIRLWKAGVGIRFAPRAVAYHWYTKSDCGVVAHTATQARVEVRLAREYPDYRSHLNIARWNSQPAWKRGLRQVVARSPISPEPCLRMAFQLVHPLRAFRPFLTLSMGILRWRIGAAFCRGAVAEAGTWGLLRERFLRRLPVLLYHHVGAAKSGAYPGLTVSPEKFRAHIEWLARWGYIGIRPSDWLMWRNKGVPLPEKSVLITFDDAYADTCDNAFPILSRFGFGAACMVVTDLIGSTNRWDERRGLPMFRLMSEQQIRCWADKGIEFGAHSRSHRSLAGLPADAVANEVDGSKEHLTRVTGKPVLSFAYPFGLYDDLARARVAGTFELAFTTEPVVNTLSTDPHLMGRTEPLEGDNPIGFRARLRWGFNPAARLRAKLCRW